jgi:hypothetical protein
MARSFLIFSYALSEGVPINGGFSLGNVIASNNNVVSSPSINRVVPRAENDVKVARVIDAVDDACPSSVRKVEERKCAVDMVKASTPVGTSSKASGPPLPPITDA